MTKKTDKMVEKLWETKRKKAWKEERAVDKNKPADLNNKAMKIH